MGQVTIYLDNDTENKMKKAAKACHLSVSKWVASVIEEKISTEWPQDIVKLAGCWKDDFPTIEEIRSNTNMTLRGRTFKLYLLDTNALIYFFKGMGKVAENLLSKSPKDIFIPSITLYELEVGIAKSNNPKKRKNN